MSTQYETRIHKKVGTVTKEGLVVGRDKRVIPPDEVQMLASVGCTDREIAEWFAVDENTLRYNFKDYLAKGRSELKHSLRRTQLRVALDGNVSMLIWLGKNILGQSDNPQNTEDQRVLPWQDTEDTSTVEITEELREELAEELEELEHNAQEKEHH